MSDRHVRVGGIDWACTEMGAGPLVLFLHGTLSGRVTFADTMAAVTGPYRLVAIDWPGHGESGWDPAGWTADDLVAAMPELVSALGEESAILVGLSQGGAIATRTAIRYPELVDAMVLINASPQPPGPDAVAAVAAVGDALAGDDETVRRDAAAGLQRIFHAPGWLDAHPDAAERELQQMLAHPREGVALAARVPATYRPVSDQLSQIRCPTLVVWGERDPGTSRGPEMVDAIPDAELVVLPGAGHLATLEAAAPTAAAISGFLARVHPDQK
ncbi:MULTISPECIES: alpha/beta fold hydrolase [unclassified Microbacterium]|uniref:alpha/beta fold hydrolase n=1 Tax=unclassified Microbacterium TaxID=2609290 RepID=UPI0012FD0B74|nr:MULTISPECIES: alpha/beta hydrolase [unclassified Microbacterium]